MPDPQPPDNVRPLRDLAHSIEAERAVLGALLIGDDTFRAVKDVLSAEDFYLLAHQLIYGACCELVEDGSPIDPVLVHERLEASGALVKHVPLTLVFELSKGLGTAANVRHYSDVVAKTARVRRLQLAAHSVLTRTRGAGAADVDDVLAFAHREIVTAAEPGKSAASALGIIQRPADATALRRREKTRFIPLSDLPERHGWGAFMDKLTGGGIAPGSLIGLGAAGTGAGKTAFLMQLLDGLALRSAVAAADPEATVPLTPVLILSEMAPEDLECRTLGRLLDVPGAVFAAGESAKRFHKWAWVEEQYNRAAALMDSGGAYAQLARWQRVARPQLVGAELVQAVEEHMDAWLVELQRAHPGREIIPFIAVDPINRFLEAGDEVETLGEAADLFDRLADRRRWVVAMTADTNKTAAKEPGEAPTGAAVFRGTMQLLHAFDLTLVLSPDEADADGVRRYGVWIDKNRNGRNGIGLEFRWLVKSGLRFVPETEDEYRIRTGSRATVAEQAPLRARFVVMLAELARVGVRHTKNSIRGRYKEFDLTRDGFDALIDSCLIHGEVMEQPKAGRGGGCFLVPTAKGIAAAGLETTHSDETEKSATGSADFRGLPPSLTSADFADLGATTEDDSEKKSAKELCEVITLREKGEATNAE